MNATAYLNRLYQLTQLFISPLIFCSWLKISKPIHLIRSIPDTRYLLRCTGDLNVFLLRTSMLKKISSAIPFFIITLVALTATSIQSLVDEGISVVSSDPNVLEVTALGEGKFHVIVKGPGLATLIATSDVDLSSEVKVLTQHFDFEVIDVILEANHFELPLDISDLADRSLDFSAEVSKTGSTRSA